MSNGNTINDTLNFGKNKGRSIKDVLAKDPGYLAWLRDEMASSKRQVFFDQDMNDRIDAAIRQLPRLRGQHKVWADDPPTFIAEKVRAEKEAHAAEQARLEEEKANQLAAQQFEAARARDAAYANTWGAW